jgi:excisionase family DNA binding protein
MAPRFGPMKPTLTHSFGGGMEAVHQQQDNDICDAREGAKLLHVSLPNFYALTRAGKVPHLRIGNRYRYRRSSLLGMEKPARPARRQRRGR